MSRGRWAAVVAIAWAAGGCPSSDDECATTADCSEKGLLQAQCVNGACIRACERDDDCGAGELACEPGDVECEKEQQELAATTFVCEALVCVPGCPDVPCAAGESCIEGRCAAFFESFEAERPGDFVTLESRGWNDLDRTLRNNETVVVWKGVDGCGAADPRDRCAGPAAHGEYYLALERVPTPERGAREFGVTCTACKCCLECRDPASRTSTTSACPGVTHPDLAMCSLTPPAECSQICAACDACAAAPSMGGEACDENDPNRPCLNTCESQAALRTCSGCAPYDQCVADKYAEMRACPGGAYPACAEAPQTEADCGACLVAECEPMRDACWACRDGERLRSQFPNEPERWRDLVKACQDQGNDGCWATPIRVRRTELFDDEQALESPAIDLTKAAGTLVLDIAYVPFNVGETYTRVRQDQPRSGWPVEPQAVAVQLCGGACEQSSSWVAAKTTSGREATFPTSDQRNNGLLYAQQNASDWLVSTIEVAIPDALKTSAFRFRVLPRLADDTRVGVDRILIRRRK